MAHKTVETDRGTFAYRSAGTPDGPSLVFVPDLGDDKDSWDAVLAGFGGYNCVAVDNRGIGSSPITDGPYTIGGMAEDLHAILSSLGITGAPVVGSSMGGAICQELALSHPDDVSRLVLSNSWAKTDGFLDVLMSLWIELAEAGEGHALWDSMFLFRFSPGYIAERPDLIDEFRALPLPDLRGFAAAAAACRGHNTLDRLAGITQPTLVIAGGWDILTESSHARQLQRRIPHARFRSISAGHLTFNEQPDHWIDVVSAFLEPVGNELG